MRRRLFAPTLLVCTLAVPLPSVAVSVESWSASSGREFAAGTFQGTALDEQGRVRLAPATRALWGPDEGIVWDLAADGDDAAWVGLSSPGRLLRVGPEGDPEVWFGTEDEVLVAAVAADPRGGVFFGLSPSGKVLRSDGPGKVQELGETGSKFVWAMTVTADGSLWIGTGLPGKVLRRLPGGEWSEVFDTGDDPVRCIAPFGDGGVVIGTGGRGRVVRLAADGAAFVVFDSSEAEIVALDVADDGVIYALAAQGSKQVGRTTAVQRPQGPVETVRVTASAPAPEGDEAGNGEDAPQPPPRPQPPQSFRIAPGAALYRVQPDGSSRGLWSSSGQVPFDMARAADGSLFVATGDSGRIYRVDARGGSSIILSGASEQSSALARTPSGGLLLGSTNDARVDAIGPWLRDAGTYLSEPIDAGTTAEWGELGWDADVPRGARIEVFVRAGNTAEPDATWTGWKPVTARRRGRVAMGLPSSRWFQVRLDLGPSASGASAHLERLELFYLPRNRAPVIDEVSIEDPGVVWTASPVPGSRPRGPIVADDPVARKAAASLSRGVVAPVRKSYELGARTIAWKASDPDDDRLEYRIEVRREGSSSWIPLASRLEDAFLAWDTRGMPDGFYRARLSVDDSRDNTEGKQLTDRQVSRVFRIDNTRPSVSTPKIHRAERAYRVEFSASDAGGNVAAVEVAVDGGQWQPLDPLDGVADSSEERYETTVDLAVDAAAPVPTLRVRVTDSAGNLGGDAWAMEAN